MTIKFNSDAAEDVNTEAGCSKILEGNTALSLANKFPQKHIFSVLDSSKPYCFSVITLSFLVGHCVGSDLFDCLCCQNDKIPRLHPVTT